jgi:O-antigen ligase
MNKNINLNFYEISLFIFGFFPIIPNRLKGFSVFILLLTSIFIYNKQKNRRFPIKKVLQFSSIYLVLIASLVYTSNLSGIDKLLSTRLSLMVVPISFGFFYSTEKEICFTFLSKYTKLLLLITTFYSSWILIFLYQLGVFSEKMSMYDAIAYITNEMWLINQHPIYASIFISISILLSIYLWLLSKNKTFIFITLPFVLINLFTLVLLERKGVLLSFVVSCLILILKFLENNTSKKITIGVIVSGIIFASFFLIPSNRFKELYKLDNYTGVLKDNSTSLRFGIYNCSVSKIFESPLLGFGLGDVQTELDKCYEGKSKLLLERSYNSHNQYLSYFLSSGLLGFFLLCFFLIKTILNAKKSKDYFLISITVFFTLCMLFENILERQSGVILFSFYICLFSFNNFNKIDNYPIEQ